MTNPTYKRIQNENPQEETRIGNPISLTPNESPKELGTLDAVTIGLGATLGGATSGMAIGMVAGPVGAAIGAAIGAVAGGFAGKSVGVLIDPTIDDNWLRDEFSRRPYVRQGQTFEEYVPIYQFGARSESSNLNRTFEEVEADLMQEYESSGYNEMMPWDAAKPAISDAYGRAGKLRWERASRTPA